MTGDSFDVGGPVSWTTRDADRDWFSSMLGDNVTVETAEEHHADDPGPRIDGTVIAIDAAGYLAHLVVPEVRR